MRLIEIRSKNFSKSPNISTRIAKDIASFDATSASQNLINSQRKFFEEVAEPHSVSMCKKYCVGK